MLFAALAPLFLGMYSTMMVVTAGGPAVANEHLEEGTGLIKSWRAATDLDTNILKQAIENGLLDGYTTKAIMKEYPRYQRFTAKCLGDKVSNLKRALRDAHNRMAESKLLSSVTMAIVL